MRWPCAEPHESAERNANCTGNPCKIGAVGSRDVHTYSRLRNRFRAILRKVCFDECWFRRLCVYLDCAINRMATVVCIELSIYGFRRGFRESIVRPDISPSSLPGVPVSIADFCGFANYNSISWRVDLTRLVPSAAFGWPLRHDWRPSQWQRSAMSGHRYVL